MTPRPGNPGWAKAICRAYSRTTIGTATAAITRSQVSSRAGVPFQSVATGTATSIPTATMPPMATLAPRPPTR